MNIINGIILGVVLSVDSVSVGMAYGLNNTKVPIMSKIVIFIFSVIYTSVAIIIGSSLKEILPKGVIKIIGSLILFIIGINMIFKSSEDGRRNGHVESDIDNSGSIDIKEAILLASTLSVDAFATGIASASIEICRLIFPVLIGAFQLIFLTFGMQLGRFFTKKSRIKDRNMSIISGFILIVFSIAKLI